MTEAVAARYREVLPDYFVVETNGPVLSLKGPGNGRVFFGNFILHVPLMSATRRLEEFAKAAFGSLPKTVGYAKTLDADVEWSALGTTCHVRVTKDDVRVWYGHNDKEDEAVLTVRPIPRSELGV